MAWAFWYFLGKYGFVIVTIITMAGLVADNYRLRRLLRRAS